MNGFIPRKPGDQLGGIKHADLNNIATTEVAESKLLHNDGNDITRSLGSTYVGRDLGRTDIDESLKDIDEGIKREPAKKISRRQLRRMARQIKRPRSLVSKIIRWFILFIIIAVLATGGYISYRFLSAGSSVFKGSLFDVFVNQPLVQDSNGRSNFLVLGTSEDDPGHGGADLTDSILIVSVDQNKKDIYMFSVPRDLYVQYGMACPAGYAGKINSYFSCVNFDDTPAAEQERLLSTQKFVGAIFGIDIQYGIHVNHTVIKEAVDAVGGVDVDVQGSNGDPGVFDRNFDWRCNYNCYLVKYDNGIHHLDGEHALFLSMARGDVAPTYGLGNSNFDREKNQQKILIALRDKAMTTGTLTNIGAVTKLFDALGNNLRTNIKTNEIRTLMQVANDVKSADTHTLSLVGDDSPLMTSGNYNGASVVMPSAGIYEYDDIKAFIKKHLNNDPISQEAAPIVVLNGTGQAGFGQSKADVLTGLGMNVALVGNAPTGNYDAVEIYQIGSSSSKTAEKLSTMFGVTIKNTEPPVAVGSDVQFVIVFASTTS